jgi:hypothetical protein
MMVLTDPTRQIHPEFAGYVGHMVSTGEPVIMRPGVRI